VYKRFLPFISSAAVLLIHLFVPNSPKYMQKPVPYLTDIMFAVVAAGTAFDDLTAGQIDASFALLAAIIQPLTNGLPAKITTGLQLQVIGMSSEEVNVDAYQRNSFAFFGGLDERSK